ncbi:hypothetical protein [Paenibacillus sp. ISL-20]|uniref:hypothetical protein n=1 Tax=Paenibacillus sp. ISL-20 TaxID=2819163 RepID=UPI001BEB0C6A|nr:hypothetical protein [Paenibacillus sp. ISL-20]
MTKVSVHTLFMGLINNQLKRLFKKLSFDHEVNQEATQHRILNSAGPSGAHVPDVRSAPQSLASSNLLGAENRPFEHALKG